MNYNLSCIRPKGFAHSSAFREVMESLSWSLSALGHQATITENWFSTDVDTVNIVFGAELLAPNQPQQLPPSTILYNLEQPSHPNMEKVRQIVKNARLQVWDYSLRNVDEWRKQGADVRYLPIGWTPTLTRIPKAAVQDIDVLFFGWLTPRRQKIIEELRAEGLKVVALDNCYGGGRDNLISRAKVCLNLHHDGRDRFEIVRCSYLMANQKCVVTEPSSDDDEYESLKNGLVVVPLRILVDTCASYCREGAGAERQAIYDEALRLMQQRPLSPALAAILADRSPFEKVAQRYSAGCASGDMKDFLPWLREHAKGTILEIGVRDGASTSAFLSGLEQNGGVLLSVDIADCSQLFKGHPQWKFIQSSSQNPKLHAPELDVLLIDGDHTREGYRADLERFYPLVKPGGLILSHDIDVLPALTMEVTGQIEHPSQYIRDEYFSFCAMNGLDHEEIAGFAGLGVMRKPLVSRVWIDGLVPSEPLLEATGD